MTTAGLARNVVTVQHCTTAKVGAAGYTEPATPGTPPTWHCAISEATARDQERAVQGTVLGTASHIVRGPYRRDLTLRSQLVWTDLSGQPQVLRVVQIATPGQRPIETIALCVRLEV